MMNARTEYFDWQEFLGKRAADADWHASMATINDDVWAVPGRERSNEDHPQDRQAADNNRAAKVMRVDGDSRPDNRMPPPSLPQSHSQASIHIHSMPAPNSVAAVPVMPTTIAQQQQFFQLNHNNTHYSYETYHQQGVDMGVGMGVGMGIPVQSNYYGQANYGVIVNRARVFDGNSSSSNTVVNSSSSATPSSSEANMEVSVHCYDTLFDDLMASRMRQQHPHPQAALSTSSSSSTSSSAVPHITSSEKAAKLMHLFSNTASPASSSAAAGYISTGLLPPNLAMPMPPTSYGIASSSTGRSPTNSAGSCGDGVGYGSVGNMGKEYTKYLPPCKPRASAHRSKDKEKDKDTNSAATAGSTGAGVAASSRKRKQPQSKSSPTTSGQPTVAGLPASSSKDDLADSERFKEGLADLIYSHADMLDDRSETQSVLAGGGTATDNSSDAEHQSAGEEEVLGAYEPQDELEKYGRTMLKHSELIKQLIAMDVNEVAEIPGPAKKDSRRDANNEEEAEAQPESSPRMPNQSLSTNNSNNGSSAYTTRILNQRTRQLLGYFTSITAALNTGNVNLLRTTVDRICHPNCCMHAHIIKVKDSAPLAPRSVFCREDVIKGFIATMDSFPDLNWKLETANLRDSHTVVGNYAFRGTLLI
jgi:hypothetical protein